MLVLRFQKLIILVRCIRVPPPCRLRINVMYFGRPSTRRTSPQWELWSLVFPKSIAPEITGATFKRTGERRSWCFSLQIPSKLSDQSVGIGGSKIFRPSVADPPVCVPLSVRHFNALKYKPGNTLVCEYVLLHIQTESLQFPYP